MSGGTAVRSGRRPNVAARRRLGWIRWSMTAFFALTTAGCLIALAVVTAHLDTDTRRRTDADLRAQGTQIALGIGTDQDGLIFSTPPPPGVNLTPNLGLNAIGSAPVGLVDARGVAYSSPSASWLPSTRTITRAYDAVRAAGTSVSFTAPGHEGVTCRWLALPVVQSDSAVVLIGTPAVSSVSHSTVVLGLVAAVVGLVLATTLAGHLLSGLAMRPAVRQLEEQEQFLREAAHELRTPLATVSLITESGLRDPSTATAALHAVAERLAGLDVLVSSLLARARAEAGGPGVETRPLRLDQLVEVTVGELHADDRVTVDTTDTVVDGNAALIAQAVRNLVENALRHAPGSAVTVTVADRCVTVSDSGARPGRPTVHIGPPGATAVGEPGDAASTGPRPVGGTGTGLSIVTWVAEVHRADLALDRSPEGGLAVTLRFPPRTRARASA